MATTAAGAAGAAGAASSSSAPRRAGGVVRSWNAEKGFGFIRPHGGGEDLFCHHSGIEDGDALGEGFEVAFARAYDEQRGKTRAEQVTGGIGGEPAGGGSGRDPLLRPCLPYGSDVLTPEAQPPRRARAGKRQRDQEAVDASWLTLSSVVRSIGQARRLHPHHAAPGGLQASRSCRRARRRRSSSSCATDRRWRACCARPTPR